MGWMKWVVAVATQDSNAVPSLRSKINKAKQDKLNYCIFRGEVLTLEQAEAMVSLIVKHKKEHDQVHREPDSIREQD